jgi:hypothetical protein
MSKPIPYFALLFPLILAAGAFAQERPAEFVPLSTYKIPEGNAEIIAATSDGHTLVFSNSIRQSIGILDISNPKRLRQVASVPIPGEPTSVAVHDRWAAVSIRLDQPKKNAAPPKFSPGQVWILDLKQPTKPQVIGKIDIGWHPDCLNISEWQGRIFIVVAIENEPLILDKKGRVTGKEAPGHPRDVSPAGFVDVLAFHSVRSTAQAQPLHATSKFTRYSIALPKSVMTKAGLEYPRDPQPEYVDIRNGIAAVSLQENNGVALINLRGPAPKLERVFSTGIVSDRKADLIEDHKTHLTQLYPSAVNGNGIATLDPRGRPVLAGQRCADGLAFSADGSVLYTADEGEFDYTGGRGWSAWDLQGNFLWDDGGTLEAQAAAHHLYPEHRSENRGIEVEGLTTATFAQRPLAFVVAERGSFVAIYDLEQSQRPKFLQLLATDTGPEGVLALPQSGLLITANEVARTLSIFSLGLHHP